MDLRTWGFITFPKESTASACPSLVSQTIDVLCALGKWKGTREWFQRRFSLPRFCWHQASNVGCGSRTLVFLSLSSGGSSVFTNRTGAEARQISWGWVHQVEPPGPFHFYYLFLRFILKLQLTYNISVRCTTLQLDSFTSKNIILLPNDFSLRVIFLE